MQSRLRPTEYTDNAKQQSNRSGHVIAVGIHFDSLYCNGVNSSCARGSLFAAAYSASLRRRADWSRCVSYDFQGRLVLVAGGTGALGREVCKQFVRAGARVVTTYRQREEFSQLASEIAAAPSAGGSPQAGSLDGASVDTTDADAVGAVIQNIGGQDNAAEKLGLVDILVNAVGAYSGGKNVWEESPAAYERMLALNLKTGFILARAVLPGMIRQNRGWIVNVASRAGYGHSAGAALYAASKAAALSFFESLAEEVKPYAINVNSVVPSIFDTPANRRAMPDADPDLWPKPSEIAGVILFLCSEEARIIHGGAIPVYGRT